MKSKNTIKNILHFKIIYVIAVIVALTFEIMLIKNKIKVQCVLVYIYIVNLSILNTHTRILKENKL